MKLKKGVEVERTDEAFSAWLDLLIAEKGVDLEATFTFIDFRGEYNIMPYGVVVEAMHSAPLHEQAIIKGTVVKIDFANGDILHYLRHLGTALANHGVN